MVFNTVYSLFIHEKIYEKIMKMKMSKDSVFGYLLITHNPTSCAHSKKAVNITTDIYNKQ